MIDQSVLDVQELQIAVASERGVVQAVQDLSFNIGKGQVLGIVGESGCGKSMTCMSILGLLPDSAYVTRGRIRLKGQELTDLSPRERNHVRREKISLVLQNPMTAFNPLLTIGRQFIETLKLHGSYSRKQALERSMACLAEMNLPEPERVLRQYPYELSGGMLQRSMIGLALSNKPALLIADEPTTALDSGNRDHVLNAFRRIKADGETAVLLVSHDIGVIEAVADSVIVMKQGKIVENGSTADVLKNPAHEYTKLLLDARLMAGSSHEDRGRERVEAVQLR
ncbi:ABC transporter ATP-binding protein [Cohnella endophytica]|uniref:ABC transporter ATP-binding protein n=1 Tax=Cohnella endophytica TaxID=2419778 RepID=A0A494Y8U2_9BACL|nr:ABC transporter ATP-binding protein [Cohnella endophytica]RKP56302.1 ABC transporter ATP-binding protein [Cohnella endophytica]